MTLHKLKSLGDKIPAVLQIFGSRVGFVFESVDPRDRLPRFSYVGLDCTETVLTGGADDQAILRDRIGSRRVDRGLGGCVVLSGYNASPAGQGPVQGAAGTPPVVLMEPKYLIRLDY